MEFKLTTHFQDRFGQRNINFDHVKQAIKSPDSRKVIFGGRFKVTKKIGDKTIEVVYYKEQSKNKKEKYLLITVYYI